MRVPPTMLRSASESLSKSIDFIKEQKEKEIYASVNIYAAAARCVWDLLISKTLVSNLSIIVSPFAVHTVANKL